MQSKRTVESSHRFIALAVIAAILAGGAVMAIRNMRADRIEVAPMRALASSDDAARSAAGDGANGNAGSATAGDRVVRPTPVFDPESPGDDIPPVGRSLFDTLTNRERSESAPVPFPFSALTRRIEAEVRPGGLAIKGVLIPIGRSLQRTAAAPDFFAYPRAVVTTDRGPSAGSGMLLKDRIYLGYQEKSATVEVISYNEAAGRFEFQVVSDYRPGSTPRVVYANRTMCVSCHQGGGPIFSRQVWDETNANPRVAALLGSHSKNFYGIPVDRGIDIPNAIDNAKLRANWFAATQLLWRAGCGGDRDGAGSDPDSRRCRARLFIAALQYRLSGDRAFEHAGRFENEVAARIRATWRRRWPGGLALGNPDIPNRDPLAAAGGREIHFGVRSGDRAVAVQPTGIGLENAPSTLGTTPVATVSALVEIPAVFEPLALREPLEILTPTPASTASTYTEEDRLVAGLAEFIADTDVRALDTHLPRSPPRRHPGKSQAVAATERETDFEPVETAVAALLDRAGDGRFDGFDDLPFRRARLMPALFEQLGMPAAPWCCLDTTGLPPVRTQPVGRLAKSPDAPLAPALADSGARTIFKYCAVCHDTPDRAPPNFLHGDDALVASNLNRCAERVFVRLAMWGVDRERRAKTPMPPETALHGLGTDGKRWPASGELLAAKAYVRRLIEAHSGRAAELDVLLANGYEALPACVPNVAQ